MSVWGIAILLLILLLLPGIRLIQAAFRVSGAGYRGKFTGSGFDSMWTDMSEIVRPTRDGIHGREYISTAVDIGRKSQLIAFDNQGKPYGKLPALVDIPIPLIIDKLPPKYFFPV